MPNIFISYRRDDAAFAAHAIHEKLKDLFGAESITFDENFGGGTDFARKIDESVRRCDVLLAIIGDHWLDMRFAEGALQGQRRLDDPSDWVRLEIASALKKDILVVPVLVGKVSIADLAPGLPPDLADLTRKVAISVRTGPELPNDLQSLVRGVKRAIRLSPLTPADLALPPGVKVVPQGLRSFEEKDDGFFIHLLPGPFQEDGLPTKLGFWKTRVETTDPDATFRVGLIYGPSGCGKSSLIKAGLLPRLEKHVMVVYVEATATDTQSDLLSVLRKRCPYLAGEGDLLSTLKRKQQIPSGEKVLVVLDQFEQFLHSASEDEQDELAEVLRECDGGTLQAILLVRDDFLTPANRFMTKLRIRWDENRNMALVDLFDRRHAKKVLALLGQAYGGLPASGVLRKEQDAFLNQAISDLSEGDHVISVRLALLAQMFEGKEWKPSALKAIGGATGVGVAFLEDSFVVKADLWKNGRHPAAAQRVLDALLPAPGMTIKGAMRTREYLLQHSGFARCPQEFDQILEVLDKTLRLVSPTDPVAQPSEGNTDQPGHSQRRYQLTHDYLVPSLRDWLAGKKKETLRGRAELRLASRSDIWSAKPENRQLPSLWEFLNIRLLTQTKDWTAAQQRMMQKAGAVHAFRSGIVAATLLALTLAGWGIRSAVMERQNATRAEGLVEALVSADIAQVPGIVAKLGPYRHWADPLLRQAWEKAKPDSPEKLQASLALLPVDSSQIEYLYSRLLSAEPVEIPVIQDALAPYEGAFAEKLWALVERPPQGKENERLAAASALAAFDRDSPRWADAAAALSNQLVAENPFVIGFWTQQFRPIRGKMLRPLAKIMRDASRPQSERSIAASALADYAGDQAAVLADLAMDSSAEQFAILFPKLMKLGSLGAEVVLSEIEKRPEAVWHDLPLNQAWKAPPAAFVRQIEAAQGIVAERFAFCQTLPIDDLRPIADSLRNAGYRPVRLRPYRSGTTVRVAAIWARDGVDWQIAQGVSAQELLQQDAEHRKQGFVPTDAGGWVSDNKEQFAAVWVKAPADAPATSLQAGQEGKQMKESTNALMNEGYRLSVYSPFRAPDASPWVAAICAKTPGENNPSFYNFVGSEPDYSGENYLGDLQVDVQVGKAAAVKSTQQRFTEQFDSANKDLKADADNAGARQRRAVACVYLGKEREALDDLAWLIQKFPKAPVLLQYAAIADAKLGRSKEAQENLAAFKDLSGSPGQNAYLDAVISAELGKDVEGMKRLEAFLAAGIPDASSLFDAARAYAAASGMVTKKDPRTAAMYADRADALLRKAVAAGLTDTLRMQTEPDLDSLRGRPGLLRSLELQYAAVWHVSPQFTSTEVHGAGPEEHLAQCRRLMAGGYRPVSLSVADVAGQSVAASVWHLPNMLEDDKENLARRQATAAVALLRMGRPETVWPLLKQSGDPRLRSYIIDRVSSLGVDHKDLLTGLDQQADVTIRRALVLALGAYSPAAFSATERETAIARLQDLFRTSGDAGLRSATEWALRNWNDGQPVKNETSLASADRQRQEAPPVAQKDLASGKSKPSWYVNGQGQTMVVIPGPVIFTMGSPASEAGRYQNETQHHCRIGRSFAINAKLVTVAEFLRLKKDYVNDREVAPRDDCPILGATWYAAAEYCNLLSEQEKLPESEWCYERNWRGKYEEGMKPAVDFLQRTGYRLSTEAEWEYACRAGATTSRYYGESEELLGRYGWCAKNSGDRSWPVGSLKPNDWGLFDMLGNASQWCHDSFRPYPWVQGGRAAEDNGDTSELDNKGTRVIRGGGYVNPPADLRSAHRTAFQPGNAGVNVGFRIARTCL